MIVQCDYTRAIVIIFSFLVGVMLRIKKQNTRLRQSGYRRRSSARFFSFNILVLYTLWYCYHFAIFCLILKGDQAKMRIFLPPASPAHQTGWGTLGLEVKYSLARCARMHQYIPIYWRNRYNIGDVCKGILAPINEVNM